jgi:hypothetical protein
MLGLQRMQRRIEIIGGLAAQDPLLARKSGDGQKESLCQWHAQKRKA